MFISTHRLPCDGDLCGRPVSELLITDLEQEIPLLLQLQRNALAANQSKIDEWRAHRRAIAKQDALVLRYPDPVYREIVIEATTEVRFGPEPERFSVVRQPVLEALALRLKLCQSALAQARWKRRDDAKSP